MSLLFPSFKLEPLAGPQVKIDEGLLEGRTFIARNGRNFSAFLGVPYGQPPIGNLR